MSRVTSDYSLTIGENGVLNAGGQIDGWWGNVTIRSDDPDDYTYSGTGKVPKRVLELLRKRRQVALYEREVMRQ